MHSHILKRSTTALLIALLFVPSAFFIVPQKVQAQSILQCATSFGVAAGAAVAGNTVASVLSVPVNSIIVNANTALDAANTSNDQIRENCLDTIFYMIARSLLASMRQSIIHWIQSGFNGSPMFFTSPERYFTEIGQRVLNREIYELQRSGSAYGRQVAFSLSQPNRRNQYTLDESVAIECAAQPQNVRFSTSYEAGDYPTRLANAEKRKNAMEKPQGFASRLSNISQSALAAVGGVLAQNEGATDQSSQAGGGSGGSINTTATDDDLDAQDAANQAGLEAGDNLSQNQPCPTTAAERRAWSGAFLNGDFSRGGWSTWNTVTQNPGNNPLGAAVSSRTSVITAQSRQTETERTKIQSGQGFRGQEECIPETVITDEDTLATIDCEKVILTPGSQVAATLKEVTGSQFRQAELIDEVGEALDAIVGELFNQLLTMGLSEIGNAAQGAISGNNTQNAAAQQSALQARESIRQQLLANFTTLIRNTDDFIFTRGLTIPVATSTLASLQTITNARCPATFRAVATDLARIDPLNTMRTSFPEQIAAARTAKQNIETLRTQVQGASFETLTQISNRYAQIAGTVPNEQQVQQSRADHTMVQGWQSSAQAKAQQCEVEFQQIQQQGSGSGAA